MIISADGPLQKGFPLRAHQRKSVILTRTAISGSHFRRQEVLQSETHQYLSAPGINAAKRAGGGLAVLVCSERGANKGAFTGKRLGLRC